MNPYMTTFRNYLAQNPPDYGDADVDTLLDMFYNFYSEHNPLETAKIKDLFREIEGYVTDLSPDEMDRMFDCVFRLLVEQERVAFREGMKMGAQWLLELLES